MGVFTSLKRSQRLDFHLKNGWLEYFLVSFWGFGRPIFRCELLLVSGSVSLLGYPCFFQDRWRPEGQEPVAVPHMRQPVVGCTQIFRGCDETGKKHPKMKRTIILQKHHFFLGGGCKFRSSMFHVIG